ncbi:MAG: hypothetical protein V3V00_15680 [Saprospiraceae bacterium]
MKSVTIKIFSNEWDKEKEEYPMLDTFNVENEILLKEVLNEGSITFRHPDKEMKYRPNKLWDRMVINLEANEIEFYVSVMHL